MRYCNTYYLLHNTTGALYYNISYSIWCMAIAEGIPFPLGCKPSVLSILHTSIYLSVPIGIQLCILSNSKTPNITL